MYFTKTSISTAIISARPLEDSFDCYEFYYLPTRSLAISAAGAPQAAPAFCFDPDRDIANGILALFGLSHNMKVNNFILKPDYSAGIPARRKYCSNNQFHDPESARRHSAADRQKCFVEMAGKI